MLGAMSDIKTDQASVYRLCNSLNACIYPMRHAGYHTVADHLLNAQGLISKLYQENQELKSKKEEHK